MHFRAECRLREGDAEVVDEIVAVALEARIFLDIEDRDQIAGRAIAWTGHTLTPQREAMMIGDARGDVALKRLFAFYAPTAAAALAGPWDHRASASARRTRPDGEERPE